jgi:hypothetical protein
LEAKAGLESKEIADNDYIKNWIPASAGMTRGIK